METTKENHEYCYMRYEVEESHDHIGINGFRAHKNNLMN